MISRQEGVLCRFRLQTHSNALTAQHILYRFDALEVQRKTLSLPKRLLAWKLVHLVCILFTPSYFLTYLMNVLWLCLRFLSIPRLLDLNYRVNSLEKTSKMWLQKLKVKHLKNILLLKDREGSNVIESKKGSLLSVQEVEETNLDTLIVSLLVYRLVVLERRCLSSSSRQTKLPLIWLLLHQS